MIVGGPKCHENPKWLLGEDIIENINSINSLGVVFNVRIIMVYTCIIFLVNSPNGICAFLFQKYMLDSCVIPLTLLHKLIESGLSLVNCAFYKQTKYMSSQEENGIVDSLRIVLSSDNFTKPYSDDHRLSMYLYKYTVFLQSWRFNKY